MRTLPMQTLTYDVFVAPGIPMASDDIPPGQSERTSPPMSATLISGARDAVLIDPLMTIAQANALADWVAGTGKNLTTVYVTHGHGDHWFGLGVIRERFPRVRALATPAVVEDMRQQGSAEAFAAFWTPTLPGQIQQGLRSRSRWTVQASNWRALSFLRSRSATPTPTTPPFCTSPPSASW